MINLQDYEEKMFSQNGEDGIIAKLIHLLYDDTKNKYYVEFGVEDGRECNTRLLREVFDWKGLMMDGGNTNEDINLQQEFITKENIIELFQKYNVPSTINLLSVDIDFNDFYCLNKILSNYTCDIIVCEYNSKHLPNEDKIVIYDKHGSWDGTNYFGASLLALEKLGKMYNYTLIYCDKRGVNCFFLRNDIIQSRNLHFIHSNDIVNIYRQPRYGSGPNGGHRSDVYNRPYITFDEAIAL